MTALRCENVIEGKVCNSKIGNTLYELDYGNGKILKNCPICYLGVKEGKKEKYQKFNKSWTKEKLKEHKDKNMKDK